MIHDPSMPQTPDPAAVERDIHDLLVEEIEETLPEGPSPKSDRVRTSARILFALGAMALAGMIVFLFIQGGWAAGVVGLAILFFYALFGSTPWMAGALRARDRRDVEIVVDREIRSHVPIEPPRPA